MAHPNIAPKVPTRRFLYVTPFITRTDGILAAPTLTGAGSGYTQPFVQGTLTGGGVGGNVALNVNTDTGEAEGLFIASRGSGYTNPTVTFPTPAGGTAATATIYANQQQAILGTPEEDVLLNFCAAQQINSLILYELNFMDWSNNGLGTVTAPGKQMLKNFIDKATGYGVDHISAARGWDSYASGQTQVDQIRDYNLWCQSNSPTSEGIFDSITTEVEWWQANPVPSKGIVEAVLQYADQELRDPTKTKLDIPIEINVYLGKGPKYDAGDPALFVRYVDRWLVSTYVNNENVSEPYSLYSYTKGAPPLERVLDIATAYDTIGRQAKILPIFSAESKLNPWNRNGGFNGSNYSVVDPDSSEDFMGIYFSSNRGGRFQSLQQAYENWAVEINPGYPADAVWDTETNPIIFNSLIPEGIAIFESRLLQLSNPVIQTQPTPPYVPEGDGGGNPNREPQEEEAASSPAPQLVLNTPTRLTKGRKPNPKTQRELSIQAQEPYQEAGLGNPNKIEPTNRSQQLSFRNDTTKPFSLGISDIDESIKYYIDNVVQPFVYQNGQRLPIPVIYGNPEKWKAVQADGYYRDKNSKIMCPLIMFKRDSIDKNRTIANKLDANQPNLYASTTRKYTSKNAYSNFAALNNRVPVKQSYLIVVPDYVTITYSCMVMTYYMEQMNKVIEAMNYASDSYWGTPERFKFKAAIDSYTVITEAPIDGERVVKANFNIKLNGYLIPDVPQKDITALKKVNSVTQAIIFSETTSSFS